MNAIIPPITDPLGRHWQQPPRDRIAIDAEHAVMSRADFERLLDYTGSRPTGVYFGKMWRAQFRGKWWLAWYAPCDDASKAETQWREILVVEGDANG